MAHDPTQDPSNEAHYSGVVGIDDLNVAGEEGGEPCGLSCGSSPIRKCSKPKMESDCSVSSKPVKRRRSSSSVRSRPVKVKKTRSRSSSKNRSTPSTSKAGPSKKSKRSGGSGKSSTKRGKSSRRPANYNDRFLALQGRKRKPCRPPGPFADYVRDYWKAKKCADKDYNKSIAQAARDAAKCWNKLTQAQRQYYTKRYCNQYHKMKKSGSFCGRRYPRKKSKGKRGGK